MLILHCFRSELTICLKLLMQGTRLGSSDPKGCFSKCLHYFPSIFCILKFELFIQDKIFNLLTLYPAPRFLLYITYSWINLNQLWNHTTKAQTIVTLCYLLIMMYNGMEKVSFVFTVYGCQSCHMRSQ